MIKGLIYLIRYPRGFVNTWRANYRKLQATDGQR